MVLRVANMEVRKVVLPAEARRVIQWARTAVRKVARHLLVLVELVLDRGTVLVDSSGIGVLERRKKEFGGWMLSLGWDRTL